MIIEPFELKGKTIKDAYFTDKNSRLVFEFEDNTSVQMVVPFTEDDISGVPIPLDEIEITKTA